MSEIRGRVRRAEPINVTSLDDLQRTFIPGGWRADLLVDGERVPGLSAVWATQEHAVEAATRMVRMWRLGTGR